MKSRPNLGGKHVLLVDPSPPSTLTTTTTTSSSSTSAGACGIHISIEDGEYELGWMGYSGQPHAVFKNRDELVAFIYDPYLSFSSSFSSVSPPPSLLLTSHFDFRCHWRQCGRSIVTPFHHRLNYEVESYDSLFSPPSFIFHRFYTVLGDFKENPREEAMLYYEVSSIYLFRLFLPSDTSLFISLNFIFSLSSLFLF